MNNNDHQYEKDLKRLTDFKAGQIEKEIDNEIAGLVLARNLLKLQMDTGIEISLPDPE